MDENDKPSQQDKTPHHVGGVENAVRWAFTECSKKLGFDGESRKLDRVVTGFGVEGLDTTSSLTLIVRSSPRDAISPLWLRLRQRMTILVFQFGVHWLIFRGSLELCGRRRKRPWVCSVNEENPTVICKQAQMGSFD